ncbi:transmembrane protein 145 [Aplysia californica]|nr:transmembrane protein 145 [Aplysia californica]
MLVLLLLAKGLGITTDQFKWKSVIFSLWAAYTVLNVFLYIWNLVEIDNIISNTDEWQSWPGYATLAFRIVVMFWFLYELRQTYGYRNIDEMSFVIHFGAFYLVWFCYLPILALITTQVSPLWRYKTIISINYAVDILAYAVLVHLFWPARSILFLVEGERPLPTYDLEITGLLDDMQETTLFSQEEMVRQNNQRDPGQSDDTDTHEEIPMTDLQANGKKDTRNGHIPNGNGSVMSNGHAHKHENEAFEDDRKGPGLS